MLPQLDDAAIEALLARLNGAGEHQLVLDEARRSAIRNYQNVHACPGAGKTTVIGLKLILLAEQWSARHQGICVLTHTNTAKNEIVERIGTDPAGRGLLSYPHFIGTIQDFTHTFLALPACRSIGVPVRRIDDTATTSFLEARLSAPARTFLAMSQQRKISDLRYKFEDGALTLTVPGNPGEHTDSYKSMVAAKKAALSNGFLFYSEMYGIADQLLVSNPAVAEALRNRFPVVLVDEMQDTSRFQDEFLSRIFPAGSGVSFQKVGDPDQAIFDGMGDKPNDSFNGSAVELQPISDSGRFTDSIASKVRGLSTRRIDLTGSRAELANGPACSIIVYDNDTIGDVLPRFAEIVTDLPEQNRRTIKVVGARAESEGAANPLTIQNYWPAFDRVHTNRTIVPSTFCAAARRCMELSEGSVQTHTHLLRQCVIEMLRLARKTHVGRNGKEGPVTLSNLGRYISELGTAVRFNRLMAEILMLDVLGAPQWAEIAIELGQVCGVNVGVGDVAPFMAFSEVAAELKEEAVLPGNVFASPNGVLMEVSTIHGVKGETHDATLVLETKFGTLFDVKEMLPFLIDEELDRPAFDPDHPTNHASIRAGFMKKLYVGTSRAKYLVCLAIHKDRLTNAQRQALEQKGWAFVDLLLVQA
ncbi:UvrD-helicase domain-containing protein [Brucella anthropi]|uniref:UvrD-helicase domain-containing protein n=1 Tax=Brucella anthropi TaxID=529 RepID=UPI00124DE897|nr:UvrD-helicase domain-containing protein [Brucella anthropi]KAB2727992.1 AAA family ATPase [Brucella anthropi]KAB2745164.1 AAA family ATPase [Brucella anthropi]KAB2805589.1 AAA family ATPase [Brucella anthropi]MCR8492010.1 UvrD-helicase domain-containing protein [Brucella anthropi]